MCPEQRKNNLRQPLSTMRHIRIPQHHYRPMLIEKPEFGITSIMINHLEACPMTFKSDQLDMLRRMVRLEARATVVVAIRAIPSALVWIGLMLWLFN